MEQTKILAKGAGIAFIGLILSKFLGYLYRLIIARIGTETYGLINIAIGVVSFLVIFSLLGLEAGIERYVAYFKGKKEDKKIYGVLSSSLLISLVLSLFFCVLLFIFSDKIAILVFHNIKLGSVLKFFSITIPFYALSRISLAALRAIKKNQYEVYSKAIFENVTKIVLTLILVYFLGLGLFGLSSAFLISIIGGGLLSIYFLYKQILKPLKNYKSIFVEREIINYSLHLMFFSLFYLVLAWTDTLMIGSFLTASKAGIYNVALPTASLLVISPLALKSLFLPTITTLYAQNENLKIKQVYNTINRWVFLINLPLLSLLIIFSKQILNILFGSEYISGFLCLIVLGIGYFVYSFLESSSAILGMLRKSRIILFNSILVAVLNIVLNIILIQKYGILGGAIATSISLIILGLLVSIEGWFYTGLQPIQKGYIKILIMLFIISFIPFWIKKIISISFINLALISICFIGLYIGLLLLTNSIKKEDIDLLKFGYARVVNTVKNLIKSKEEE